MDSHEGIEVTHGEVFHLQLSGGGGAVSRISEILMLFAIM
jgi:hypothetical protein